MGEPEFAVESEDFHWLFAQSIKRNGEDGGVTLKIGIGGKDSTVARLRDRANQHVRNGHGEAFAAALIAKGRSGFVVGGGKRLILKRTQSFPELIKLGLGFNAGKKFLTYDAEHSRASFIDELAQLGDLGLFNGVQMASRTAKGERPNRGVNQDVHEHFLVRSRLES